MNRPGLIKTFTSFPKEIFRLNNGANVRLRDRLEKETGIYDLTTVAGFVKPKALSPESYIGMYEVSYAMFKLCIAG